MEQQNPDAYAAGPVYRVLSALFGLVLVAVGLYVIGWTEASAALRCGAGLVLVVLGGNALLAAWRGTPSWLSRIGPLP